MSTLYTDLADLYEGMYAHFIDYELEFRFYERQVAKINAKSVLELGCGTGNLAASFMNEGYEYLGLDLSEEMIKKAKVKAPLANFLVGDMTCFSLGRQVDAILITARSISYLVDDEQVRACFECIAAHLNPNGIIVFDFIDAERFVPAITPSKVIVHEAPIRGSICVRKSVWTPTKGGCFRWQSEFTDQETKTLLGKDDAVIRSFWKEAFQQFLSRHFNDIRFEDYDTYTFPAYLTTATKRWGDSN